MCGLRAPAGVNFLLHAFVEPSRLAPSLYFLARSRRGRCPGRTLLLALLGYMEFAVASSQSRPRRRVFPVATSSGEFPEGSWPCRGHDR